MSYEFTFGIITNGGNLFHVVNSIRAQNIPTYEIIIVGEFQRNFELDDRIVHIPFDESVKAGWITKKKNLIAQAAKYERLVMMHDYIVLHPNFYAGFVRLGDDWNFCVTQILNGDGSRFRDYILFPYYSWWKKHLGMECNKFLLPYWLPNDARLNRFMYVSGSFYCIKKTIALQYPLNEDICWGGEGEDVELCVRLANDGILIKMNPHSTVQFMKMKDRAFCCPQDHLDIHDIKRLMDALRELDKRDPEFFKSKLSWLPRD
jgi:hypothetical protein